MGGTEQELPSTAEPRLIIPTGSAHRSRGRAERPRSPAAPGRCTSGAASGRGGLNALFLVHGLFLVHRSMDRILLEHPNAHPVMCPATGIVRYLAVPVSLVKSLNVLDSIGYEEVWGRHSNTELISAHRFLFEHLQPFPATVCGHLGTEESIPRYAPVPLACSCHAARFSSSQLCSQPRVA